ncbi:MAG: bifunctional demethylmenaquinone methyltransferase/2-methoxy-6-polyprenyl-1,4-benzoquinol methylase UbiE [Alphaproteobacteria bacterium]
MANTNTRTHFGKQRVKPEEKTDRVRQLFARVAGDYDRMNDYMSLGTHRLWKDATIAWLRPRSGEHFLDLAGGSGDLALRLARTPDTQVTVADLTPEMLARGRIRALNRGLQIKWVHANAENLPFKDETFNATTLAFGLRNVANPEAALAEALRTLKIGGRLAVLEFSTPNTPIFAEAYDLWAQKIIPSLARKVGQDQADYQYLGDSISTFPDADALAQMMTNVGFQHLKSQAFSLGLVGLHLGYKF